MSTRCTAPTRSCGTADQIFRTYFIDNRGDEAMGSTWAYLDITALGRQEDWEDSPEGYPQSAPYQWWHRHDEYPAYAARDPRSAQYGRVASTNSTSTAIGASSGTHGSRTGSDTAARPTAVNPTAPMTVGAVMAAVWRSTR